MKSVGLHMIFEAAEQVLAEEQPEIALLDIN